MSQKSNREISRKSARKSQDASARGQKQVRKRDHAGPDLQDVEGLKISLSRLVGSLSAGGTKQAYVQIAEQMSQLAGRNGNAWGWRYVASVHSGSLEPGKKFLRVLALLLEEIHPRAKCWYYFAKYHSVAAVFDKCLKREMITEHMKGLGYKAVTFTRYMELKTRAVRSKR